MCNSIADQFSLNLSFEQTVPAPKNSHYAFIPEGETKPTFVSFSGTVKVYLSSLCLNSESVSRRKAMRINDIHRW